MTDKNLKKKKRNCKNQEQLMREIDIYSQVLVFQKS